IRVAEAGAVHGVSSEIPEVERAVRRYRQRENGAARAGTGAGGDPRIADGIVEPLRGRSDASRIADEIRSQRVVHTRERTDGRDDVNRAAGLRLSDHTQLPAFDEPIAFERQFIDRIDHEAVPDVEIRRS